MPVPAAICVLGLGNLMRTDDAVGMLTTRRLETEARLPEGVTVIEGGTLGLDLLGRLDGVTHLLVLDAVDSGREPGTLVRFAGDELNELPTSKSVHLLGLSDLLNVMRLMDVPAMNVVLLGVQPDSTDWGTTLTPAVEGAQERLIAAALEQVTLWSREGAGIDETLPSYACHCDGALHVSNLNGRRLKGFMPPAERAIVPELT